MKKDLIDALEDLREALNHSGVERTAGLKAAAGLNCIYYRRSKELFLERDYAKIKQLFDAVAEQYRIMEGPSNESPKV